MSLAILLSVILQTAALLRCAASHRRLGDRRLALPCLFLALMVLQLVLMAARHMRETPGWQIGRPDELPGLAVAVLALVAVGALERVIGEQRRLREQATALSEIVERAPDFIGVADADGRTLYVNPTGQSLVGAVGEAQFAGRPISSFHPAWVNDLMEREVFPTVRKLGVWQGESALLAHDGEEIPCFQVVLAHRDESGTVTRYSTIARDLDVLDRTRGAVREREMRLRMFTDQIPAIVWSCDRDLKIRYVFGAALERTSLRPEDLIGGRVGEFTDDAIDRYRILAAHHRALGRHVQPGSREGEVDWSDAAPGWRTSLAPFDTKWRGRWFRGYIQPLVQNGDIVGTIGVALDIHDQRVAEEAARDRGTRLDILAEQIPAILWSTDRDFVITSLFGAGLDSIALPVKHLTGRSLHELLPESALRESALALHRAALRGVNGSWEGTLGDRMYQVFLRPLLGSEGETVGTVGVAIDVTELRQTQADLEASREGLREMSVRLERVREQERRSLARDVHDELGQVLTALRMEIMDWIDQLGADTPAELERAAAQIQLVDEALAQVRSIAQQLRPSELDDLGLIDAIRSEVKDFARRSRVRCELHTDIGQLPSDFDRDTALYRIVKESLTNVSRHADASHVEVHLWRHGHVLKLEIVDDGRGIRAGSLEGSTLGVVGMQERAHALGGSFSIERRPEGGTSVTVQIPLNPRTAGSLERPRKDAEPVGTP